MCVGVCVWVCVVRQNQKMTSISNLLCTSKGYVKLNDKDSTIKIHCSKGLHGQILTIRFNSGKYRVCCYGHFTQVFNIFQT